MKKFQQICALRIVANGLAVLTLIGAALGTGCRTPEEPPSTEQTVEIAEIARTGMVIVKDDTSPPTTLCVELTGPAQLGEASGIDVLTLSKLDLAYQASASNSVLVCRIDSAGCDFPAEGCLCQCENGDSCRFWSYWQKAPGEGDWQKSERGGAGSIARAGGLEGWVFGSGDVPPPNISFSDLCS